MAKATDIELVGGRLYFLPVTTRVPLKFGAETLSAVTCARAMVEVADRRGRRAIGWGETPLSAQWVWPSPTAIAAREARLRQCCNRVLETWVSSGLRGHPIEVGWDFQRGLRELLDVEHDLRVDGEAIPWLAALLCASVVDQALHDAFGNLLGRPVYETYNAEFMERDLGDFLEPAADVDVRFRGRWPQQFLRGRPANPLAAWHLVGGLDPLSADELTGREPADGYPVLLADWIERDQLRCLKVKLRGTDEGWDVDRLVRVGRLGLEAGVERISADFNCTVSDPAYVHRVLDRIEREYPALWAALLYVEQPFPYELEPARHDVRALAKRRLLFLDESAHDWRQVRLGRELGWNGVALKTCKTQTGALLSACWAKSHGIALMVQDLTNPMLAQVPHVLLAAWLETLYGVETNAMQFYPEASVAEAEVHPGLYRRRGGRIDLSTVQGPGFGYRHAEMNRVLPPPAAAFGSLAA